MVQPRKNQAVLSDRIHKNSVSFHSVDVGTERDLRVSYLQRSAVSHDRGGDLGENVSLDDNPRRCWNGTHPKKNGQLASGCNGASLAGGIFYRKDSLSKGNLSVTAGAEGAFMALSAYLYTSARRQKYLIAADLAHQFIQSQLYNSEQGFVMDAIDLASCNRTTSALTYNTGLYLEALSVLGMATGNSTLIQLANQLAANAVKSPWVTSNGIIVEGSINVTQDHSDMTYKGILVRALYEHWNQSPRGSSIANLIESFLLVQYNAVLNDARAPNTSWYSPSWNGPPASQLLPWGQLAAIDILNAAIGLGLVDSPTTSSSINSHPSGISTQPMTSPSQKRPVGAIVGGTLGGFFFLAILGIIIVVVSRRRRRRIQTPKKDSDVCSLDNERTNPETSKINDHVNPAGYFLL
ncbi:hypothetical protein QCA50_008114 [Cerrena zonata]|uniref:Cellulase n=1 Tax=Cerrena zonata TaxID=2478898 RepID=A0AAW0GGE3_9APHY